MTTEGEDDEEPETTTETTSLNLLNLDGNVIASARNASVTGEDYYFYNKDERGSTTNIIDDTGASKICYTYDDFGETTAHGDTDFYNEICYTGGVYDDSTELYYLNARYYDPENGRFTTQDTYRGETTDPNTWHLYAYCVNNPIDFTDPSGHWGWPVHYQKTKKIATDLNMKKQDAERLANGDLSIDNNPATTPIRLTKNNAAFGWHFDRSFGGTDTRIVHFRNCYKKAVKWGKKKKTRNKGIWEFGRGLHALQDKYAHRDWWAKKGGRVGVHEAYKMVNGRWKKSIDVFDDPDYDLRKANGKYYAYYKGDNASKRYTRMISKTKQKISKFLKKINYKK